MITFEAKDGKTYMLVEGTSTDCEGCAFEHSQEACHKAADDCLYVRPTNGKYQIWVEA